MPEEKDVELEDAETQDREEDEETSDTSDGAQGEENGEASDETADADVDGDDDPEALKRKLKDSEEKRAKLYARLKRQEGKGKKPQARKDRKSSEESLTREEAILFAKGLTEEEVEHAKKVAEVEGVRLTEAVGKELFVLWKEKRDKERKEAEAQLGASRGSRGAKKVSFDSDDLSDEDHRRLFNEALGR